jgi:DNA-binding CsgD family transcriptional regulator
MSPNLQDSDGEKMGEHEREHPNYWQLFPFIFTIYTVGGLMYAVVGSLSSPTSGLLSYYVLLPYIFLLFLAGFFADRIGRRINAIAGAIIIGIGFMAVGLLRGHLQFVAIQTLLVGGYAFLDVFTWVIPADASRGRKIPLMYSAVLGTNILAILAGVVLGEKIGHLAEGSEILTVSLAGIFSFLSLAFIIRLKETLQPIAPAVTNIPLESLESIVQRFGLTPRESDVVELLITGASTQEIRDKLVIAPDTLKRHLRNIYRKAGVRNRLEFTMAVMNKIDQTEASS